MSINCSPKLHSKGEATVPHPPTACNHSLLNYLSGREAYCGCEGATLKPIRKVDLKGTERHGDEFPRAPSKEGLAAWL